MKHEHAREPMDRRVEDSLQRGRLLDSVQEMFAHTDVALGR